MNFRMLVLPIVLAGVLSAQGPGPRAHSLTPPTPAELLQRQVDFLTKFYDLTTAPQNQVSQVTTILSTEQSCLPTSADMQSAREALVTAIKAGPGGLAAAVTALNNLQGERESCRATAAAGIYAILTPAQQMKGLGPLLGFGGRGPGRFGGPPRKQ